MKRRNSIVPIMNEYSKIEWTDTHWNWVKVYTGEALYISPFKIVAKTGAGCLQGVR